MLRSYNGNPKEEIYRKWQLSDVGFGIFIPHSLAELFLISCVREEMETEVCEARSTFYEPAAGNERSLVHAKA